VQIDFKDSDLKSHAEMCTQ